MNQLHTNLQTLLITRDGQLTDEYEPTIQERILNGLEQALRGSQERIKVEVIAASYDLIHGTKFNKRRHELLRQQRNERHIAKIGLVRTTS